MDMTNDSPAVRQTRVAIIGTGLAGLTTAYLLQHDVEKRYAVTLFEQANTLSFDSASVAVKNDKTGVTERIDLPMRALADGYYENLLRMYTHLRIPLHPIRFLFVFAKAISSAAASSPSNASTASSESPERVGAAPGTYFVHASNLHQMPPPWPGTRSVVSHIAEAIYLIVCYFWFSVACFCIAPLGETASGQLSESFAEYLKRIRMPRRYVSHYLLPLMSSVATCSHDEILAFPASDLASYKKLSHWKQHYTVCGGVKQVQLKLANGIDDAKFNARVVEVVPESDQSAVTVRWQSTLDGPAHIEAETFDRVILAVSPDVAGNIFSPLKTISQSIPTLRVESSVLRPETNGERSAFTVDAGNPTEPMACMHHVGDADVHAPQTIMFRTLFSETDGSRSETLHTMPNGVVVSTCPLDEAAYAKRALQTARFTRTLRSTKSRAVVERIMNPSRGTAKKTDADADAVSGWVNGEDNVWLTGAWCWDGMVLLEGCVVSAMRIADNFGVRIPWQNVHATK